jgi:hypothetical protein
VPVILDTDLLASLEERWRAAGALYLDEMGRGLSDAEIDHALSELGFDPPEEARRWYRWHNGSDRNYVTPARVMTTIAEDVEQTLWWRNQDPGWQFGWLHVMDEQPHVAFDCRRAADGPVAVWHYDPVDHPTRPVFQSIGDMVSFWITLVDEGYLTWSVETSWRTREPLPARFNELLAGVPSD